MKTLSLKTCQAIQSLEVEVESSFWWNRHLSSDEWELSDIKKSGISNWESIPSYTLSDLVPVLRAIGEKKGWGLFVGDLRINTPEKEVASHFIEICRIFAKTGSLEGEAEEYILELLK